MLHFSLLSKVKPKILYALNNHGEFGGQERVKPIVMDSYIVMEKAFGKTP